MFHVQTESDGLGPAIPTFQSDQLKAELESLETAKTPIAVRLLHEGSWLVCFPKVFYVKNDNCYFQAVYEE